MISVVLNWCWIGLTAFLIGYASVYLLNKVSGYQKWEWDIICCLGICALTVYAQFFSLFYKVGLLANLILFGCVVAIAVWLRKEILQEVRKIRGCVRYLVVLGLAAFVVMIFTTQPVSHYDTFLYHAQSIRWIEEYGVVKGLGNLHNRLAYNSAVFSLEALFGMKDLFGRSMHGVNGFVVAFFLGYALSSFKAIKNRRIYVSDCFRIAMIIFIGYPDNVSVISSSGSDLLAIGLVIYILIKWVSYLEEEEKSAAPYAYLCIMAVFAMTVKLSAAMIILLVFAPAIQLLKEKRWSSIAGCIGAGVIVLLPFLARNVLISGYLIYPYPEIDLFDVDWKMPAYTLLFDRNEIKTWGWGLRDVTQFDASIGEWFPVWYAELGCAMQILFWGNIVLAVTGIGIAVSGILRKKDWNYTVVFAAIAACLAMWFVGSPLPRYGSAYMLLLPAFVGGELLTRVRWNPRIAGTGMTVLLLLTIFPIGREFVKCDFSYELRCPDYEWYPGLEEIALDGKSIYVPTWGDQVGYYPFPSTPYAGRLALIELRGNDWKDGFRMKEGYQNAYVSTYGEVYEENMFTR